MGEEDLYYLIRNVDGDTTVFEYTKEQLMKLLNEDYIDLNIDFFDTIPLRNNTNYWGNNILIVKGKIVKPKPKMQITRYTVD